APDFSLKSIDGKTVTLAEFKGRYVVLEWMNHGCPFIKKHYNSGNMQALQRESLDKGAVWLSICSSAKGKEGYNSPEDWAKISKTVKDNATAHLIDADGKVGKAYGAKATPHMFIVDPKGVLIYQGAIDDKPTADAADIAGAKNY